MDWDCAESIAGLDAIRFGIGIKQITFLLLKGLHCQCTPQGGDIDRRTDWKGTCGIVIKGWGERQGFPVCALFKMKWGRR